MYPLDKRKILLFAVLLLTAFSSVYAEDIVVPDSTNTNTRGIEREEVYNDDLPRDLIDGLLYIPRSTLSALLYGTGRGAYHLSDPDFIQKVESIFYLYKHQFGWYPNANIVSDNRAAYGMGFFHKVGYYNSYLSGLYTTENKWKIKSKFSLSGIQNHKVYKASLRFELRKDDDREFSGFGTHPITDSRNNYLPSRLNNTAVFGRERSRTGLEMGVRTSDNIEFDYSGYFENLKINPVRSDNSLEKVFNIDPAFYDVDYQRIVNEIAVQFDTRKHFNKITPGNKAEVYLGVGNGLSESFKSSVFYYGFDIITFIPVIRKNRIVSPRIVFNAAEGLSESDLSEFQFFPHHSTFRGVSSRKQVRTDKYIIVPSIDYNWPLNSIISSSIFADAIIATDNLKDITIDNTPNAYGWALSVHGDNNDVASFRISTGTQGLRLKLIIGFELDDNER